MTTTRALRRSKKLGYTTLQSSNSSAVRREPEAMAGETWRRRRARKHIQWRKRDS
jgi:hypothetical protein